jgi:hypothetical protein
MSREDYLRQLAHALQGGRYQWEPTAETDAYRVTLDSGMIVVARENTDEERDFPGTGLYSLAVLDEKNREIARLVARTAQDAELLRDVWEQARNAALKPDETLTRILHELLTKSQ